MIKPEFISEKISVIMQYCLGVFAELAAILVSIVAFPLAFFDSNPVPVLLPETEKITIISHGYLHNRSADLYLRSKLDEHPEIAGSVFSLNLGHPFQSIEDYTATLHNFVVDIKKNFPKNKQLQLNLIGHSMGGLVCSNYAVTYAEKDNVQINKIVTIASPLKGTTAAYLTSCFCQCTAEMIPDSAFLSSLQAKVKAALKPSIFFHIGCGMDFVVSKDNTFFGTENNYVEPYQGHMTPLYSSSVANQIIKALTPSAEP